MRIKASYHFLGLAAIALAVAIPATADAAAAHGGGRPVTVTIAHDAISVPSPDSVPGGLVTFTVSTPDASGHELQLLRLKPGGTLNEFIEGSEETDSTDPATAAAGIRQSMQAAVFLGGTSVYQQTGPVSFTEWLSPGTYYLLDYNLLGGPDPAATVKSFHVTRGGSGISGPAVNAVIDQTETNGHTQFDSPPVLPSDATVLVRNETSKPLETLFAAVKPGTTDAYVQSYLDAVQSGATPPPDPFLAPPPGLLVLGPVRQAIVHATLPPGTYVLLSFVHDPVTGLGGAFEGMHKVVTVVSP
jgi:hypothetical protein